jgi:hypothetical protein
MMHKSTVLPAGRVTRAKPGKQGWDDGDKRHSLTRSGAGIVHPFTTMHIPLGMNVVPAAVTRP